MQQNIAAASARIDVGALGALMEASAALGETCAEWSEASPFVELALDAASAADDDDAEATAAGVEGEGKQDEGARGGGAPGAGK